MQYLMFSGSKTAPDIITVSGNPVYQEVMIQRIEMKENSAYGTAKLAAGSRQLEKHGKREETTPEYEYVSQL